MPKSQSETSDKVKEMQGKHSFSDNRDAAEDRCEPNLSADNSMANEVLLHCCNEQKPGDSINLSSLPSDKNILTDPSILIPASTSSPHQSKCYFTLRRLFFANNCITDWDEISKVGQFFPNLEYLLLSETNITDLGNPEDIPEYVHLLVNAVEDFIF